MEWVVVPLVALIAALLTLFSGFGLGTLLLPAFLLCFHDASLAVAATAVVHLANNLFKAGLIGRHAAVSPVLRFGIPAALSAFAGAWLLGRLEFAVEGIRYTAAGHPFIITPVGAVMGGMMILFAALELSPRARAWSFAPRWLILGGVLSGFFGGLSGHQGALRAAFLNRCGLDKNQFVATGVACAVIVDVVRLAVYGTGPLVQASSRAGLVGFAILAAFIGSYAGARLLGKTTLAGVQRAVGIGLLLIGTGTVLGWW